METQCFFPYSIQSMSTKCDLMTFKTFYHVSKQCGKTMNATNIHKIYIYAPFDFTLSLDLIHDKHEQTPDILILTDNKTYPSSSFDEACVSRVNARGR